LLLKCYCTWSAGDHFTTWPFAPSTIIQARLGWWLSCIVPIQNGSYGTGCKCRHWSDAGFFRTCTAKGGTSWNLLQSTDHSSRVQFLKSEEHNLLLVDSGFCGTTRIIGINPYGNNINPLNPELNFICYILALLGAHHFLHVSRIRVKLLTFRRLMSYIYGAPILDVSRSHTTTQHSR